MDDAKHLAICRHSMGGKPKVLCTKLESVFGFAIPPDRTATD
jgi:hypothetical protein